MDGVVAGGRIFDADGVAEVAARDKILGVTEGAAVIGALDESVVAAAIDAGAAAVVEEAPRRDVEYAGGAQPILRRQRAGEQAHAADEVALQDRAEAGHTFGQQDAVDARLRVRILVANVVARIAGRGIVGDARQLQDRLVHRCLVAAGKTLDVVAGHRGDGGADLRQKIFPRLVQGERIALERGRIGGRAFAGDGRSFRRPAWLWRGLHVSGARGRSVRSYGRNVRPRADRAAALWRLGLLRPSRGLFRRAPRRGDVDRRHFLLGSADVRRRGRCARRLCWPGSLRRSRWGRAWRRRILRRRVDDAAQAQRTRRHSGDEGGVATADK